MFTNSVFVRTMAPQEQRQPIAIIWRRRFDCWDFFTRSPIEEAEGIVVTDAFLTGLDRSHYDVRQG